jgi:hypothetical protein
MSILLVFRMPNPVNITGRTSSITNSFVNGIIPCIPPTEVEVRECLNILGLTPLDLRCAYCSDKATEWDHFRPLVKNKKPTGYISDIYNLVPSCGKCNQSKGNKDWRGWIQSSAVLSPKTRGINNLEERIQKLANFEKWKDVKPINFENLVDKSLWEKHWKNYEKLCELMKECQKTSLEMQKQIRARYDTLVANQDGSNYA